MNIHVKVIAVLHILSRVLGLIAAIVIFAVFGCGSRVILQVEHGAATVIGIVAILIGAFLAVLALPGIIGGWGYSRRRSGRGCSSLFWAYCF